MDVLRFNYFKSNKIFTPFKIEKKKFKKTDSFIDFLSKLFPEKEHYFSNKNKENLFINLIPSLPFGPDIDLLIDFLFDDLLYDILKVKKYFNLKTINLIGYKKQKYFKKYFKNIQFYKKNKPGFSKNIILNLNDFYKLYSASINGEESNNVLFSIFLNYNKIISLFVPIGISFKKIFNSVDDLKKSYKLISDNILLNPLTFDEYDIENDYITDDIKILSFKKSNFKLIPKNNLLFPFPYFNNTLVMKKIMKKKIEINPCINCLKCVSYCPSEIYPNYLYHLIIKNKTDETLKLNIKSCIKCGNCGYVCPSGLPLYKNIKKILNIFDV